MKDTGKQLLSILSKLSILALIAFPVLAGIDHFTNGPFTPYEQYKKLLGAGWDMFTAHWEWVLALFVTPILCKGSLSLYAPLAEDIRHNLFEKEMIRWMNTPYISPIHHLYMRRPPRWLRWENINPFRNTFYSFVVQGFRDLVYRRYEYKEFEPSGKRPNVWKVIPKKTWLSLSVFTLIPLLILAYDFKQNGTHLFAGYYSLVTPLLLAFMSRIAVMVLAIKNHASWKPIDRLLMETFGEIEPKTRWMELYPNQGEGNAILETWKAECHLRQDRDYQYRANRKLDVSSPRQYPVTGQLNYAYDNPSLPNCPYPEENIPDWAENYDMMYVNRKEDHKEKQREEIREVAKASGGKVLSFEAKRRRS